MAKKKKDKKEKAYKFYGLNVKLLSDERSGDSAYFSLIEDLYKKDVAAKIASEKAMTLRNQFRTTIKWKGNSYDVLYGKITRFTLLEGDNWYNKKTHEFEKVETPLDKYPNGFETDYYFIPAAHRFFIKVDSKVGINSTERFLQRALKEVTASTEDFSVHIIQSEDALEQILSAKELSLLKVNVSYTNDDIGKEAQELIDDLLKNGQVGELDAVLKPDQKGTLDPQSNLVKGLLEISRENGTAEATIKDNEGKRKKIITHEYPQKITIVSASDDDVLARLLFHVLQTYRDE